MKLSAELWREVEPLLSHALELGPDERRGWLEGVDASHPGAAPMLRRMLATHDRAERARELETATLVASAALRAHTHVVGRAVGPFVLVSPLGRGGMGEVWLARHSDGHLERDVALKLPASHQQGEVARERFRRERAILARLEHPNIARLYDAGVTEHGQPWLAMDVVHGVSLTQAAQGRPIADRIALFRQVLDAVAHAHRHLVVHRDLKPGNILVDERGQVKLLDFGIAKLLAGDTTGPADLTRMGGRVMTPRYAAPEQVSGNEVTTATDIYSLGVVLHELLAGVSPYRAVREGRPLTELALLQEEPGRMSRLPLPARAARALAGDLDAIVLKAMRFEPAERYATVGEFDADLAAHLARRPVAARAGTWRYLAGRFALRHRLPIAAATVVLATLVTALVTVEQQRRAALEQKTRAERHFASVRQLANTFIFDVHGEIEQLAGSLKARQALVATASRYLDTLAAEDADPALAVEVAAAYRRLAEISGDARGAHLGDHAGAKRHAQRAAGLLDAARAARPDDITLLRERRVVGLLLGRLRLEGGDKGGVADTAAAARTAEDAAKLPAATPADRRDLGATLAEYGGILAIVSDDHEGAATQLARAVDTLESAVREAPADVAARASLGYAYERAGTAAEVSGRAELLLRAVELHENSVAVTELVARDEPLRAFHAQKLVSRYNNAARVRLKAGDVAGARERAARGIELVERLAANDSRNVSFATQRVSMLAMASDIEGRDGKHRQAIALARESLAAYEKLAPDVAANLIMRDSAVEAKRALARAGCALAAEDGAALRREAQGLLAQSRAFKQELVGRGIDARDAGAAITEIEGELARCGS